MAFLGRNGNGRNGKGHRARKPIAWGECDTALAKLQELGLGYRGDEQDDRKHHAPCPLCSCPDGLTITEPRRCAQVQVRCSNGCEPRKLRAALGLIPDATLARRLHEEPPADTAARPAREHAATGHASSSEDPEPWRPLPGAPPPFPLDALPADMRSWVEAIAEQTQTPEDLAAMDGLGVLSAAALGRAVVDCGCWQEELALFMIVVLLTGERKSASEG